jgi:hypothetical protein
LSLARRESCQGPQCNARHKSDGNDLEFGFHIRRELFAYYTTMLAARTGENKGKDYASNLVNVRIPLSL